ncbi:MAG: DUF2442 domain-containing protein [Erysipelotrichaceae bacterium]|nr:DUF2442 domain-containing protein [Erysipelotrichaceae bacterium]
MFYYANKVKFLEGVVVELTFQDGKIIQYDLSQLFSKYPQFKELLLNRALFENGKLDPGGYGVIWNDQLDIDATAIYYDGVLVGQIDVPMNQSLGVLLAETRESLGITQTELSKMSHIDQGDISRIERGIGNPTIAKIERLFNALGKRISIKIE